MLNTIGYEGASLEDFIQTLEEANVEVLLDIRDRAQSRKKGFSKTALSNALQNHGIEYVHLKELGDPKEGRLAARSGNWDEFDRIYRDVMASQEAIAALEYIRGISENTVACLLCYERDHKTCHRKYVSDAIDLQTGTKTRHLGVRRYASAA